MGQRFKQEKSDRSINRLVGSDDVIRGMLVGKRIIAVPLVEHFYRRGPDFRALVD
jgi:hypothetical protein